MKYLILVAIFVCSINSFAVPPAPGSCRNGTWVSVGPDDNGCMIPPVCVRAGDCPQFSPPGPNFYKDGQIVNVGVNSSGCALPPACVHQNSCPNFSPPYCPGGHLVDLGVDKMDVSDRLLVFNRINVPNFE